MKRNYSARYEMKNSKLQYNNHPNPHTLESTNSLTKMVILFRKNFLQNSYSAVFKINYPQLLPKSPLASPILSNLKDK